MNPNGKDGHHNQENDLEKKSRSTENLSEKESFESTVVIDYMCKQGVKSKMNSFGKSLKKCFLKSKSSKNLTKTLSKNSMEDDADSNLSFLYNTSIDDFRSVTICDQPIRFIVSDQSSPCSGAVQPDEEPTKSERIPEIQLALENEPKPPQIPPGQVPTQDHIEVVCCSDIRNQVKNSSIQVQLNEHIRPAESDYSQIDLSLPMKAIDSKTLISKTPGKHTYEKATSTDDPDKEAKQSQAKKGKKIINTFRDRQLELHRFRVDVEKKRLELLELKLTREREEIMHERVKFERDLEYKELVIKQIKEESQI